MNDIIYHTEYGIIIGAANIQLSEIGLGLANFAEFYEWRQMRNVLAAIWRERLRMLLRTLEG